MTCIIFADQSVSHMKILLIPHVNGTSNIIILWNHHYTNDDKTEVIGVSPLHNDMYSGNNSIAYVSLHSNTYYNISFSLITCQGVFASTFFFG